MNAIEHLTKEQIAGYAARSLDRGESREIGRHLLQCADCRNSMPAPTTEQFWSAIMGDSEPKESLLIEKSSFREKSPLSKVFSIFRQPQTLVWSAGALIVVFAFSVLIWLGAIGQSEAGREVVQTVETTKFENNHLPNNKELTATKDVANSESNISKIEVIVSPQPSSLPKVSGKNHVVVAENSKKPEKTETGELAFLLENTPPNVSSLRPSGETILRSGGNNQNSNFKQKFGLIAPVGETVLETQPVFQWKKAANAKSYRITIFDENFNEVLTKQVSGNSFKLDKPLNQGTKYLWRVAAQTDDGEMLAPQPPQPPAMFRVVGEKVESRIETLKKSEKNRFDLAVFYAKEGMLDSARCTLNKILKKNPRHKPARRLLAKVEQWQKENQTHTQRCEPPTETKPAQ